MNWQDWNPSAPYSTSQSTGSEPIVITSSTTPNLQAGDYAVISDAPVTYSYHSKSAAESNRMSTILSMIHLSPWNLHFIDDYGQDVEGNAFVYEVGSNLRSRYSHQYVDDGFTLCR
ncbi:MAG: hypothetical protein R3A45_07100 [Bdellovibrionota bacterium]